MSLSVEHRFELERLDIGNAFLKGFSFKVMREICQKFGITVPDVERQVFITVPGNVWYYLAEDGFYLDAAYRTQLYVLIMAPRTFDGRADDAPALLEAVQWSSACEVAGCVVCR